MNKTLYVKDPDIEVWDKAKELANDRLSPIITEFLRGYVNQETANRAGFKRIVVNYNDAKENGLPRSKAFFGRWIIPIDSPYSLSGDDDTDYYAVAITAKNNLVIYKKTVTEGVEGTWQDENFYTFSSFEDAVADNEVRLAVIQARKKIGVPTEELDI